MKIVYEVWIGARRRPMVFKMDLPTNWRKEGGDDDHSLTLLTENDFQDRVEVYVRSVDGRPYEMFETKIK